MLSPLLKSNGAVSTGLGLSISISTIRKELGIVKKTESNKKIGLEHAERLSHKGAVSDSHAKNPISISTIQKELGIVNKEESYQSANAM